MKFEKALVCVLLAMTACTEPGETTGIAAATGSVIGAGVGAIVGNQTGHPGSGFVIGSVAGAGAGALVGNAFEAQEKVIKTQEEALKRQGRQIQEQQGQIEELRRLSQDNIAFRDNSAPSYNGFGNNNVSTFSTPSTIYHAHRHTQLDKELRRDARR